MGKNRDQRLSRKSKQRRGLEIRKHLLNLAGDQCFICGYDKLWALEFHHLERKRFTLSGHVLGMIEDNNLILAEFQKCILLCANCHKGVHSKDLQDELECLLKRRKSNIA